MPTRAQSCSLVWGSYLTAVRKFGFSLWNCCIVELSTADVRTGM
jgi:hypothetical protein